MIHLEPHPEGTVLPVLAVPGARKSEFRGQHGGALKVAVTQAAEKGKANKALVAALCKALGLKKSTGLNSSILKSRGRRSARRR